MNELCLKARSLPLALSSLSKPIAASVMLLSLAGCATWSEDGGFGAVALVASSEIGVSPARISTPEAAIAADAHVTSLLMRPLTAESAVWRQGARCLKSSARSW